MGDPVFVTRYWLWVRRLLPAVLLIMFVMFGGSFACASSEGGHGPKGWVATDSYRVFNFTILAVGVFFAVRKPVASALGARIRGIKLKIEDLEAQKSKVESELAEYDKRLTKLGKETEAIVSGYVKQGEEAKARILAEAEVAVEKLKEQASKNIEHEFAQAKIKLRSEVVDKALTKAEEIIRSQIGSDDQEKLVDEYLEKVVA